MTSLTEEVMKATMSRETDKNVKYCLDNIIDTRKTSFMYGQIDCINPAYCPLKHEGGYCLVDEYHDEVYRAERNHLEVKVK